MLYAPTVCASVDARTRIGVDGTKFDVCLFEAFSAEVLRNPGNAGAVVVERQRSEAEIKTRGSVVRFRFGLARGRRPLKGSDRPAADVPLDFEIGVVLTDDDRQTEDTPSFQRSGLSSAENLPLNRNITTTNQANKFPNIGEEMMVCLVTY